MAVLLGRVAPTGATGPEPPKQSLPTACVRSAIHRDGHGRPSFLRSTAKAVRPEFPEHPSPINASNAACRSRTDTVYTAESGPVQNAPLDKRHGSYNLWA